MCTYCEELQHVVELAVDIADQNNRRAHDLKVGLAHEDFLDFFADLAHKRLLDHFFLFDSFKDLLDIH